MISAVFKMASPDAYVVFDPQAKVPPRPVKTNDWGREQHLYPVIQQVNQATGMPMLAPTEIRGLLDALAKDVSVTAFALSDTSKRVRDECRSQGLGINRADTSYVLKGILLAGHAFGDNDNTRPSLARSFIQSMKAISAREQVEIDEESELALMEWATGSEICSSLYRVQYLWRHCWLWYSAHIDRCAAIAAGRGG